MDFITRAFRINRGLSTPRSGMPSASRCALHAGTDAEEDGGASAGGRQRDAWRPNRDLLLIKALPLQFSYYRETENTQFA